MASTNLIKFPQMLHGGDYNPDQWLACPDVLEQDIKLMKQANVNVVSLGIFAWAALEPKEGEYHLEWLEHIVDRLFKEGIYTILATPTAAMPQWLTEDYPEVMQVRSNRVRNLPGKRHNFCYTSPVMRAKAKAIDTVLAERLGNHEGVILWHISNELGGNFTDGSCHCPHCQSAFRIWLKEKYETLEKINEAWWTPFWSHTYTKWEQIQSPAPHGENLLHGLNVDWKRFVSSQILNFYKEEVKNIRQYSDLPVTTNMMQFFKPLDYFKFQDDVDIFSWDSYPEWHSQKDEIDIAVTTAAMHNMMRSIRKAPFLLMESTPSITNWKSNNIQMRPGMHMLSSMQAVAQGSNSVQYFQWRKSRGSYEKLHGAVVGHEMEGNTRTFQEVSMVGERLRQITDDIYPTCNSPKVAIVFDWENWWALDDMAGAKQEMKYVETVVSHYKPFWEMGIEADFINMDQNFEGYQLIIAPMLYMLREPSIQKIKDYVNSGGTYITTYWSNIVNETDLCYIGKNPLEEVLGVICLENDSPNEYYKNTAAYHEKEYEAYDLCDILELKGASAISLYGKDYYENTPAVTVNSYGKGQAYYIASRNEQDFQKAFYQDIVKGLNIEPNMNINLPYGVTVSKRVGQKSIYFIQNFNSKEVKIVLDKPYCLLEENKLIAEDLVIKGYGCIILKDI